MSENRQIRRRFGQARARAAKICALRQVALRHAMAMAFALLALAIQSFVIQTHIHIPQAHGRSQSVSLATLAAAAVTDKAASVADTASAPRDKYPIKEDPTNCPLCQEIAHSGQFVQSAVFIVALPFLTHVHVVVFDEALPSLPAASHIWQGRAPPKA
jgi:hypothetical protein